ncbi:hypothetical protein V6N11_034763 [Hibiscus sabdariffa]|uniref:Uncharacterized protein n=1 Tax=Hibiscus sabdariffa TaxID=183260 RepID=A0ABR2NS97_9ROSI
MDACTRRCLHEILNVKIFICRWIVMASIVTTSAPSMQNDLEISIVSIFGVKSHFGATPCMHATSSDNLQMGRQR